MDMCGLLIRLERYYYTLREFSRALKTLLIGPIKSNLPLYLAIAMIVCCSGHLFAANIPQRPDDPFIYDQAGILNQQDKDQLSGFQTELFDLYHTPIIIVTINSMSDYRHYSSIESLATEWYNAWGIGKVMPDGTRYNRGILLLVSIQDRKARIELGAEWGNDWNKHCQKIMDHDIIPSFKQSDYSRGILKGAQSLEMMGREGPEASPPFMLFKTPDKVTVFLGAVALFIFITAFQRNDRIPEEDFRFYRSCKISFSTSLFIFLIHWPFAIMFLIFTFICILANYGNKTIYDKNEPDDWKKYKRYNRGYSSSSDYTGSFFGGGSSGGGGGFGGGFSGGGGASGGW